ncbi:MAG: hypothetical protein EPN79_11810 [Burkholderiaceae bacterium]|nr:MAG: hypothetical protein EPN79_11810 [Burkholderiaceae bacterium]TBR76657.1 MAG: hypothetical protein EPN64_05255 [Burkholderiaceae bacterium]
MDAPHAPQEDFKYMNAEEATKAVEGVLLSSMKKSWPQAHTCCVVLWGERPGVGVRVAEVSFVSEDGKAGISSMDCDSSTLLLCALAERSILARMVCTGYNDSEQALEVEDADAAMLEELNKDAPASPVAATAESAPTN